MKTAVKTLGFRVWAILLQVMPGVAWAQSPGGSPLPPSAGPVPMSPGNPTTTAPMADIHDIKGLAPMPVDPTLIYWAVGIGLLIVILLLLLWGLRRWWKKRRGEIVDIIPEILPHEAARQALAELARRMGGMTPKEFYFRLSAVFRAYLHGRFQVDAPEMTTEELLPKLSELGLPLALQREARQWLCSGDSIKFAGASVPMDQMRSDMAFVETFVSQTIPAAVHIEAPPADKDKADKDKEVGIQSRDAGLSAFQQKPEAVSLKPNVPPDGD